jgi:hypothetical protein
VAVLYGVVLQHAPDPSGLAAWVAQLQAGVSRTAVAQSFWESPEHRGQQVDLLYLGLLHRPADAAGRDAWVRAMSGGVTEQQVERALLLSPEYLAAHPTPGSLVNGLFADLFGRAPDPTGGQAWFTVAMRQGAAAVVDGLLHSAEQYLGVIESYYLGLLGRQGDNAGLQGWLAALNAGATYEAVAEAFLASDEFFADAASLFA